MRFTETPLKGSYLIDLEAKEDNRGFFARFFCKNEFAEHGLNTDWLQINNSLSKEKGTLRGLHFQLPPYSETKLVRCVHGVIYDVIVDLRKGSDTFGKWFAALLTDENRTMMYVPEGFAHGFISMKENSELIYLVSQFYQPNSEGTLIWNDPDVGIEWPIQPVVLSEKDTLGKNLNQLSPIAII